MVGSRPATARTWHTGVHGPEQAEGQLDQIDHRTDIYGLGTILFAILTGRPPHPGDDTAEVLQRIISGDTPQARSVDPTVPAALNAICHKAMAKNRTDRYDGASDLGEDVQRWLADEPVSAHRDPWTARAARWLRRNRAWAQAGAAGLLFCLFVSVVANIIVNRARLAEAVAREETARHLAEVRAYERDLASIRNDYANLLGDVGRSTDAEQTYLQALTAVENLAREFRDIAEYQFELATLHHNLGILLRDTGRPEKAEAEYRNSLAILREMHGDVVNNPEFRSDYARSLNSLGQLLTDTKRTDEAVKSFGQAIKIQEKLAGDFPLKPDYRVELAGSYTNLGTLLLPTERLDEAEAACRKAVVIQKERTDGGLSRCGEIQARTRNWLRESGCRAPSPQSPAGGGRKLP
ncbi:MAG: tetratricopeptide repeat protein [Planctomycetes bacterium]|nr:tetratricopeptide repeat protein [Planctomycetota bacterium]